VNRFEEPLRSTVLLCALGAALALGAGVASGHWRAGLLVGVGLLIGSANGFLARGALRSELDFRVTSGVRILALTAAAIGLAAVFDIQLAPFAVAGVAGAQMVMALVSGIHLART
jgi:hypothetical protein